MKKLLRFIVRAIIILFIAVNIIAAFNAYKFTHFYNAGDIAIQKQDKKNTWDKIKEIVFGKNAFKLKNTVTPGASFQTVYLTTKDSLKLQGWYIKTDSIAKGTVILFHGHSSNKSAVINEASDFLKMGYNTLLLDFRAHGNSEGNTCTIGYYESEDVKLAYDYINGKGEKHIILWGISMGAAAIIKAINDSLVRPSKIILEMPYGSILQAAQARLKIMGLKPEPLATLITFWGGVEHGFWAFDMKPSEFAKKINCPVLLQWGTKDPRVSKAEIDAIYGNIHSAKKLVLYDNCGHESLCSKENDKWNKEVKDFLLQ
jgi:alpha-beta hydrolase superfamily lysophospholipase